MGHLSIKHLNTVYTAYTLVYTDYPQASAIKKKKKIYQLTNARSLRHHVWFREMVVHVELAVAGGGSVAVVVNIPMASVGLVLLEPAAVEFLVGG